jgi:hypothetical protein
MTKSKTTLPHESPELFLTDCGLETTLVFIIAGGRKVVEPKRGTVPNL